MNKYSHPELDELLKDPDNQRCFDCNKHPTQWASCNNAVYLCIECSGVHRSYGVNISYVRSLMLDNWSDSQIEIMKCGGNKNLQELLDIYKIDKTKVNKEILYNSRLLDFYRKYLKTKVNNSHLDQTAPSKEDALKSANDKSIQPPSVGGSEVNNKFQSIGSNCDSESNDNTSLMTMVNSWMGKAFDSAKSFANKVNELNIPHKVVGAGQAITKTVIDKGTEISVR